MFSEKNISKLIIVTPVLTVLLSAFFTIYFFVKNQYAYFNEESKRVEKEYLLKQKNILKKEVDYVINYLEHHSNTKSFKDEKALKENLIKYIESIRYEKHGYIWIHDTNYYLIAHPFRKNSIGTFDIGLVDANGTLITKKFIDETLKKPNGVFIEYYWQKPNEEDFSKKLGFFRIYGKYNWVVGAGLYVDEIEKSIQENKKLLEDRINKYIRLVVIISLIVILLIGFLSFYISNNINKAFASYKENVKRNEELLQDLNKNLENKVEKALEDAKKKDRAMLHQSRLARMGVMLSMIAHQWRQPLTELSGVLMEIETANKFKQLDDKLLNESISESNKLIQFMSHTIDDFRNFFKPDKTKVDFDINISCDDAISLAGASIKSSNIKLTKVVKKNCFVNGYKREFAQVMLNLISNAKDILNQREIKNPEIYIEINVFESNVIILVEDNAGGVLEDHLDLIFEPYFTTKESSKGTGLGLYMSKMIIETNMNGELSVENVKTGAQFKITLPI